MRQLGHLIACCFVLSTPLAADIAAAEAEVRPNILWITCEDISPDLGCYGRKGAVTPNLDRLAAEGVLYTNAFSVSGVCAPSRSCLITGVYPSSLGSHNMRCRTTLPSSIKCFTEHLRGAGYYCSNNVKTDYNFPVPAGAWDESSRKAHWRGRKPGQPFFSVFNFTTTHESQIRCAEPRYEQHMRGISRELRHDPAKVEVPPYHPDMPEVRRDWARYHDLITAMDRQAGDLLRELEEDGLAEETIVFFFSDHGAGMPRCKKWIYDCGTRVPLIVRFPAKLRQLSPHRPGSRTDRLVSFVDFAPTILSLAGAEIPRHVQGRAFLGVKAAAPREYVFAMTDRMAERYDFVRSVRDKRYLYIRNYMPHVTYAQHVSYTYQMPTMQVWARLAAEGKLSGPPRAWFAPTKPLEELYDTQNDPYQIRNLADKPEARAVLERMRAVHLRWLGETHDVGLLPEYGMLLRSQGTTPYEMARDANRYPQQRILAAATLTGRGERALDELIELLGDEDAAVRFWAAVGLSALGPKVRPAAEALTKALQDSSPNVRIAAAQALWNSGSDADVLPVLIEGLRHESQWVRLRAANVLDQLGGKARPALPHVKQALKNPGSFGYANRALRTLLGRLRQ